MNDAEGRYVVGARLSGAVVGAYAVLLLLIVFLIGPRLASADAWVTIFLVALTVLFLARYLSTRYVLDDVQLKATRILGGRRVPLEDVRAIEFASLRSLVPTGGLLGMGSWGWRGRMYSSTVGEFDSIFTDAASGLMVTAGAYPLYISPKHPEEFARELSRRVRSYTGPLLRDVGYPGGGPPSAGVPGPPSARSPPEPSG
jgi:hypothetical protein